MIIDDNFTGLDSSLNKIEQYLKKQGVEFVAEKIEVTSDWKMEENLSFNGLIKNPELDMILVDFNLDDTYDGYEVIKYIREQKTNYHAPIIFYTADDIPTLIDLKNKENVFKGKKILEGIYFEERDKIEEKAICIFHSLLEKEKSVAHGRGLLLDTCSEMEAKIKELILLLQSKIKDKTTAKNLILNEILKENNNDFQQAVKALDENTIFSFMVGDRCRSKTFLKVSSLIALLSMPEFNKKITPGCIRYFSTLYAKTSTATTPPTEFLMDLRNTYGHKSEKEIMSHHTDGRVIDIRKYCTAHLRNVEKLIAECSAIV